MLFVGIGCDRVKDAASKDQTLKAIKKEAGELLGDTELSIEEVKKLRQMEYHVTELKLDASAESMSSTLSELGKERWSCFHIERRKTESGEERLLVFCRRPVHTPLRYVSPGLLGR